ncbi:2-hydroxyacid dehydrogenase [Tissierella sp. MSJ-40]|uniref:2-hydroxyacid dehydrogenase n=1 Tax=Tissierella simiarum TaxID=2841534 RepID=A0ABS6EB54_9FIRM|nr:2-hydroxyacid dehydrogenase [Tissierella simiarum]MBU5440152.1 2-hydroxyacid dehydrogenase [Tissierella simiarum]
MNILAISDNFIDSSTMEEGLKSLKEHGINVEVRNWYHDSIEELQKDNLIIEQNGPEGIVLSEDLLKDIDKFHMVIVQFAPISKAFIDKAKNLKAIGVLRGGVENIAVDYAKEKNIAVLNTPGRNARSVAEFTMGLILSEVRNIARSHYSLKNNYWRKDFPNSENIPELNEKTVGLVGFGYIGQLVAGYLKAFGCNILAYDPFYKGDFEGVTLTDLDTLLKNSDIVSIHARLTEETHHLISKRELSLMKENSVLINSARSGLVDQQALVKALKENKIGGAAIDVFDKEPIPEDDEILKLDNITITAHMAGSTKDAFSNSPKMMAKNILSLLNGKDNLPIVNGVKLELNF